MRVWIYGRSHEDIHFIQAHGLSAGDALTGSSIHDPASSFPLGGLTRPMQAALRGELDQLFLSDPGLLGGAPEQARKIVETFQSYSVSVRSASNSGSSSS